MICSDSGIVRAVRRICLASVVFCLVGGSSAVLLGQGITLRGVGAVNDSMAGAATAAPLSAAGALHWNPATIADFRTNSAELGIGMILPDTRVASTVGVLTGSSRSEPGIAALPTLGLVLKTKNPRLTLGLGVYAIAGFKLNYEASTTNPIHLPQGSLGALPTLGRVNTGAEFFQIAPTFAWALSDSLSFGFAPTMTVGKIDIEPLLASPPGPAGYPTGSGTRYHFGGGAQAGLYYKPNQDFAAGFSVKSKQYFEDFRYRAADNASGLPVRASAGVEYPLILSLGTSLRLNPCTLLAADVRYLDYGSTELFGESGLRADGSVAGLGWQSVMAVALGLQRRISQRCTIRTGYVWNENPISSDTLLVNSAAPLNVQHVASIGLQLDLTERLSWSTSYLHGFDKKTSGLYAGVPGTDVSIRTAAYLVSTGFNINF
jgi:long-chain fatty acid transport protein